MTTVESSQLTYCYVNTIKSQFKLNFLLLLFQFYLIKIEFKMNQKETVELESPKNSPDSSTSELEHSIKALFNSANSSPTGIISSPETKLMRSFTHLNESHVRFNKVVAEVKENPLDSRPIVDTLFDQKCESDQNFSEIVQDDLEPFGQPPIRSRPLFTLLVFLDGLMTIIAYFGNEICLIC